MQYQTSCDNVAERWSCCWAQLDF